MSLVILDFLELPDEVRGDVAHRFLFTWFVPWWNEEKLLAAIRLGVPGALEELDRRDRLDSEVR